MHRLSSGILASAAWLAVMFSANADQAGEHMAACVQTDLKQYCDFNRQEFVENFSKAYRGDYQAQRNVAYCLDDGCYGAVQRNAMLACAWRMVIIASGSNRVDATDISNARLTCGRLDALERTASDRQAKRLAGLISGQR